MCAYFARGFIRWGIICQKMTKASLLIGKQLPGPAGSFDTRLVQLNWNLSHSLHQMPYLAFCQLFYGGMLQVFLSALLNVHLTSASDLNSVSYLSVARSEYRIG